MAFHDEILRDIRIGRVLWRFKTKHLKTLPTIESGRYRVGNGEFSENTINTVPRNYSVRPDGTAPGDYVRKGRVPAFFWHGSGEYELILDHPHCLKDATPGDEAFDLTEGDGEELITAKAFDGSEALVASNYDEALVREISKTEVPSPAAIIVRYIAEKPFQAFYRRQPLGSMKHGWGERLTSYYWPLPDRDWNITSGCVYSLSRQIQQATSRLVMRANDPIAADELLAAFKATCVWGGVRLPESDASKLAQEVHLALGALSDGSKPPAGCRLNSAWTKLYAFALPDRCVIYDSRVATALTSILDPVMNLVSGWAEWRPYTALGKINGRAGSRPRDLSWAWPNGYREWASQLAANRLCSEVLQEINRQAATKSDCQKLNDPSPWTLREVEAVLFMEGY